MSEKKTLIPPRVKLFYLCNIRSSQKYCGNVRARNIDERQFHIHLHRRKNRQRPFRIQTYIDMCKTLLCWRIFHAPNIDFGPFYTHLCLHIVHARLSLRIHWYNDICNFRSYWRILRVPYIDECLFHIHWHRHKNCSRPFQIRIYICSQLQLKFHILGSVGTSDDQNKFLFRTKFHDHESLLCRRIRNQIFDLCSLH